MLTFGQILFLVVVAIALATVGMCIYAFMKGVMGGFVVDEARKAYNEILDKTFEYQQKNLTDLFKG